MFNLIFDVEHEFYCLHFRPGSLSFKQAIILQLKIFVNMMGLSVLFSLPVASMMIIAYYLDSL